jgi:divalent metal cation (Fe/Co/Zn/Cd) transporter
MNAMPPETTANNALAASAERGRWVVLLGLLSSVFLAAVKIISGLIGHSYALIADGIESILGTVWKTLIRKWRRFPSI